MTATAPTRTIPLNLLLTLLPILAVLPVLLFALALLELTWDQQRAQAVRDVEQATHMLAVAVDRELNATARELARLAEYPTLDADDADALAAFGRYAKRLVAEQEAWDNLVLVDSAGRQLVNVKAPEDIALPRVDRAQHRAALATGKPALSDIYASARTGELSVGLSVPVLRNGAPRGVLTARLDTGRLVRLLTDQSVRSSVTAAILDRDLRVVARNVQQERYFGYPASADLQAAARQRGTGSGPATTLEGTHVLAAWERIPLGWTVTVGIPQEAVDAPIRRQIGWLAVGGLLLLFLALAVSLSLARKLGLGLAAAIDDAQKLAAGRPPTAPPSRVRELARLFDAMRVTHQRLTDASEAEAQANANVRASEERLRLAMDSVNLGSFDWNLRSNEIVWPARTRELFGFSDSEQPTPQDVLARVHPQDVETLRTAARGALDPAGDGSFRAQCRLQPPGHPVRWLDALGRVSFEENGDRTRAPVRCTGVAFDITALKEMELSLREADRRKDDFLAMLSHELRNPLTPIANALAILRLQPDLPAAAGQAVTIAERQVKHIKRLIDDLLDISRITRGKIAIKAEKLDLGELVRDAVEGMQAAAATRQQRLRLTLPPQPLPVRGDRARLTQVIENLLTNAMKFSPNGGLIEVAARADGGEIVVEVRDEGVGIPAEHLNAVFDIFTQLDTTIDRTQGGLGIGLALVKRLVAKHGGSVSADSRGIGHGSTFTVRLPRLDDADALDAAPAAAAPAARRVLVVDDNSDAANTLVDLLRLSGHAAEAAYDGAQALQAAQRFAPDVVLLDIGLPGLDGLEVGRRLRAAADAPLRLVAISGYGQDQDRAASAAAGFDLHLVKPITADDLLRALDAGA